MSIANELSSDIAAALFTRTEEGAEKELKGLTAVVLEVHSTLRRLAAELRRRSRLPPASPPMETGAASGGH